MNANAVPTLLRGVFGASPENAVTEPAAGQTTWTHPSWCTGQEVGRKYDGIYHQSWDEPVTVTSTDRDKVHVVVGIERIDEEPDEPGETTIYVGDEHRLGDALSMTIPEALAVAQVLLARVAQAEQRGPVERYVPAADLRLGDQIWTATEYGHGKRRRTRTGWHTVCSLIGQPDGAEVTAHLSEEACDWDDGLTFPYEQLVRVRREAGVDLTGGCCTSAEAGQ